MGEMQCYNKGCGVKFNPKDNTLDSCCFHPGEPIFHDAYKGWSCCNKRSTDFTTFLNTKGCSRGSHCSEKIETAKEKKGAPLEEEFNLPEPSKPIISMMRPDLNSSLIRIPNAVSQSLKQALEKINSKLKESTEECEDESSVVKIGEACKNNACKITFEGEGTNLDLCKYHPGFPIFHEGMKYWSCCQRKTCDFDVFLNQEGCLTGSHLWIKKAVKQTSCRYDWHQTGGNVYLTIYAKNSQPDLCSVDINPIRLLCNIVFGESSEFHLDLELDGIVDPSSCKVSLAATKAEICMKKAEAKTWGNLGKLVEEKESLSEEKKDDESLLDDITVHPSLDIDSIDLSDI